MFDLSAERQAWIPIQWPGLRQDGENLAEPMTHEIEVLAVFPERDELEALGLLDFDGTANTRLDRNLAVFQRLVKNWRKVGDAGTPLVMTAENIQRMLRVPMFEAGFAMSYLRAWAGSPEIREKNLDGSAANGQADALGQPSQTSSNGNAERSA